MRLRNMLAIGSGLIVLSVQPAMADERALQQALAKAQFMLKQATAEKVAAQQELAELKETFGQFKQKSENELEKREQGAERLAGNVNTLKDRYQMLVEKHQQLQVEYKKAALASQETDSRLTVEHKKFQLCFDNNKKLFDINQEILGNYEDKGFWDVLNHKEPFTGFASVKLETLIQDYQYQNEDLKLDDSLASSGID